MTLSLNSYLAALDIAAMKTTDHRVLFQNADGSINMGVCLNDPDMKAYDISWLNYLAYEMNESLDKNEGLVFIDNQLQTRSCYVELQRNGSVFQNNKIINFSENAS